MQPDDEIYSHKNITHEYLQNTYGEVVSPEHAEFIIELAELHGLNFDPSSGDENPRWFVFIDDELYFIGVDRFTSENRKQIIKRKPKSNHHQSYQMHTQSRTVSDVQPKDRHTPRH